MPEPTKPATKECVAVLRSMAVDDGIAECEGVLALIARAEAFESLVRELCAALEWRRARCSLPHPCSRCEADLTLITRARAELEK